MTPTSFDFTVTMPGDERLSGAIRQLAAHAAGYARLPADAGEGLAGHVERATAAAMASCEAGNAPIEFRFSGGEDAIHVHISCEAAPSSSTPGPVSNGSVTVDWSSSGSRRTCHIQQRLSA